VVGAFPMTSPSISISAPLGSDVIVSTSSSNSWVSN
jgi:hypothetical protein